MISIISSRHRQKHHHSQWRTQVQISSLSPSSSSPPPSNTPSTVQEIPAVINALTKGTPQQQQDTLNTYFLSNASFIHPFCRVPSIPRGAVPLARDLDSRWLILGIYRWYRTLSPKISLTVDSSGMSLPLYTTNSHPRLHSLHLDGNKRCGPYLNICRESST